MPGSAADEAVVPAPPGQAGQASSPQTTPPTAGNHVSSALRSAYEETVRETIPSEFLDLLGKLN